MDEKEKDRVNLDMENINKNNDHEEFIRMKKDYPVLGEDTNDEIFKKHKKKSLFKKIISNLFPKKSPSFHNIEHTPQKASNDAQEEEATSKKNDFILEGFEGVYYNDSEKFFTPQKLKMYGIIIFGIILIVSGLFLFTHWIDSVVSSQQVGPCPYECCINSTYDDLLCPGFAECQNNRCVLESCPETYECCNGILYETKSCDQPNLRCSENFECVKRSCPYECCTPNDDYAQKECANGGNCVNNECYLSPCPYECCVDEVFYNDKVCEDNNYVCVENECRWEPLEKLKGFVYFIAQLYNLIL